MVKIQRTQASCIQGFVILQLPPGFPDALSIYDKDWGQGRFLRKCNYNNGRCTLIEHNNPQIAYSRIEGLGGGRFKFILAGTSDLQNLGNNTETAVTLSLRDVIKNLCKQNVTAFQVIFGKISGIEIL